MDANRKEYKGEKVSVKKDWKKYNEQVKKREEEYPVDPNIFIKKKLQKYLDICATVEF